MMVVPPAVPPLAALPQPKSPSGAPQSAAGSSTPQYRMTSPSPDYRAPLLPVSGPGGRSGSEEAGLFTTSLQCSTAPLQSTDQPSTDTVARLRAEVVELRRAMEQERNSREAERNERAQSQRALMQELGSLARLLSTGLGERLRSSAGLAPPPSPSLHSPGTGVHRDVAPRTAALVPQRVGAAPGAGTSAVRTGTPNRNLLSPSPRPFQGRTSMEADVFIPAPSVLARSPLPPAEEADVAPPPPPPPPPPLPPPGLAAVGDHLARMRDMVLRQDSDSAVLRRRTPQHSPPVPRRCETSAASTRSYSVPQSPVRGNISIVGTPERSQRRAVFAVTPTFSPP
eukprot:Hpha_TRINITY_DN27884_c0_g1::TRINITY_DN27884_c0_g1_i1::g.194042::m.194042